MYVSAQAYTVRTASHVAQQNAVGSGEYESPEASSVSKRRRRRDGCWGGRQLRAFRSMLMCT